MTIDGKNCNCNLASLRKKNPDAANKKRGFPGSFAGGYDFDKRQRTDQPMMYTQTPYVTPMVDPNVCTKFTEPLSKLTKPQNAHMQLQVSIQTLYADFQTVKYEVSVMNQSMHQMKATINAMKANIDALCQRNGIAVAPSYPLQ